MYFGKVRGSLLYTIMILFYRNKKRVYDQWSNMSYFLSCEAQRFYCVLFKCLLRLENNYFVVHSETVEILNVCVLPCEYNAYGEQLLVYGCL